MIVPDHTSLLRSLLVWVRGIAGELFVVCPACNLHGLVMIGGELAGVCVEELDGR